MDRAIWATWYDLPDGDHADYFAWMNGAYLPALRQRDGTAWVAHYRNVGGGKAMEHGRPSVERTDPALGTGTKFLQLVGAASPLPFLSPSVVDEAAAATGQDRTMLDRRVSPQTFVFAEVMRVNGPAYNRRTPGTTPAQAIQMGSLRMKTLEGEGILGKWYAEERLPLISELTGAISCRVFACLYGATKYGVLYEFESIQARLDHFEPVETRGILEGKAPNPLRGKYIHAHGSPIVAERIWPPAG